MSAMGWEYEDIAVKMDLPLGTIKSRVRYAKTLLEIAK